MAYLLFSFRDASDEEIDAIRDLLTANKVDFYETPPGKWGISAGGFWLNNPKQLGETRQLVEGFHQKYAQLSRQKWLENVANGQVSSFRDRLIRYPFRVLGIAMVILFVCFLTLMPFVYFMP